MPEENDILVHQVKIYDGNGKIKKVVPSISYKNWLKSKVRTKSPRQWAYWNSDEKELPS